MLDQFVASLTMQSVIFYGLALLITTCSVMVVASRNPVSASIFLVLDLFLLAGMYAMMEAHFIAVIQVLIYAGAIVVLFMFVIMLLNLSPDSLRSIRMTPVEVLVLLITVVGFLAIGGMIMVEQPQAMDGPFTPEAIEQAGGNTYIVGMVLFTKYLWPFELASILILLAIVASVVIARKETPEGGKAKKKKRRLAHGTR